jgi:periplasmic protein TonB
VAVKRTTGSLMYRLARLVAAIGKFKGRRGYLARGRGARIAPSEDLRFRRQYPPKYPVQAVRERMEGKVILKVLVGLEGEPEEISLEKSSGYELLDRSAITAVKSWTFVAGVKKGYVTRSYLLVPIEFNLSQ